MRNWIICLFFMCACAEEAPDCDFFAEGACVITNGFPIDAEMIAKEFRIIEFGFNELSEFQGNPLLLDLLAEEHELSITYLPYPGPSFWDVETETWKNARGLYSERNGQPTIELRYPQKPFQEPTEETVACQEKYYVLGHELLHFVDYHFFQGTGGHTVMINESLSLFVSLDYPSIEMDVYLYTAEQCGYNPYGH
jgi:hypothetical protein